MSTILSSKIPPQNIEAEQSVLGSVLLDSSTLDIVFNILKPETFYKDNHRIIYSAMLSLSEKNIPIDLITVTDELNSKNKLEDVGGVAYLTSLVESVPSASNVEYYARIVEDKYRLRKLLSAASQISSWAYEEKEEVDVILDRSEKIIFDIATKSSHQYFYPMQEVINKAWNLIEKRYSEKGYTGIPTGFYLLDELTCGLQKSELIIIAGRPSMGKTAFALNIAQHSALEEKIPVAFFSLEMTKEQLALRIISNRALVDQRKLQKGMLEGPGEYERVNEACNLLYSAPIFIDETSDITPMEVRSRTRRLKAEYNIGLVIIDYLQLMVANKQTENRVQEISEISRSLKSLAKELEIPVIALSQLSRAIEKRHDREPLLSDLRESGSIEQDADVVMFIHRKGLYELHSKSAQGQEIHEEERERLLTRTKLYLAKQRNGPIGDVDLYFHYRYGKFECMETNLEEER